MFYKESFHHKLSDVQVQPKILLASHGKAECLKLQEIQQSKQSKKSKKSKHVVTRNVFIMHK
jgi:hypothetical protein